MYFRHKTLAFFVCLFLVCAFSETHAQETMDKQKAFIKEKVQFVRWKRILSTKEEVSYGDFEVRNDMVGPWRIQRIQKVAAAKQCSVTQYILAATDDPQKAQEIIRISVTRCPLRAIAAEKLIDHLLGIQRPDFRLIVNKAMTVGDIAVHIPDEPEPALLFVKGNILIVVETAGEKVPPDIRKLAQALDEFLTKKQR